MRDNLIEEIKNSFSYLLADMEKPLKLMYVKAQGFGEWKDILLLPENKLYELATKLRDKVITVKKIEEAEKAFEYVDDYIEVVTKDHKNVGEMLWKLK